MISRSKPFKYTYEKEIVMYAHFKKLDYFTTECIYSPNAYRGHARVFLKDLERIRPRAILDVIKSGEDLAIKDDVKMPTQMTCARCGYISSGELCKACIMLDGLNRGKPQLSVGKATKRKQILKAEAAGRSQIMPSKGAKKAQKAAAGGKKGGKATTSKEETIDKDALLKMDVAQDDQVKQLLAACSSTGVLSSHSESRDVQITNVSITHHGVNILEDTTIELNFGRRYGLIGTNGCGKSTMLTLLGEREFP
eukprot:sb/3468677/